LKLNLLSSLLPGALLPFGSTPIPVDFVGSAEVAPFALRCGVKESNASPVEFNCAERQSGLERRLKRSQMDAIYAGCNGQMNETYLKSWVDSSKEKRLSWPNWSTGGMTGRVTLPGYGRLKLSSMSRLRVGQNHKTEEGAS
jgi:hypothetical protein